VSSCISLVLVWSADVSELLLLEGSEHGHGEWCPPVVDLSQLLGLSLNVSTTVPWAILHIC